MNTESNLNRSASLNVSPITLSIRLKSDGLAFTIHNAENETIQQDVITIEEASHSTTYNKQIFELLYQQDLLNQNYQNICIYIEPKRWILLSNDLYEEDMESHWIRSITENHHVEESGKQVVKIAEIERDQYRVIYYLDDELLSFLSRNFISPEIKPYFCRYLSFVKQNSRNHRSLNIFIRNNGIDIIAVDCGKVWMGNYYPYTTGDLSINQVNDIFYFVLLLWDSLKMQFQQDKVFVIQEFDSYHIDDVYYKVIDRIKALLNEQGMSVDIFFYCNEDNRRKIQTS